MSVLFLPLLPYISSVGLKSPGFPPSVGRVQRLASLRVSVYCTCLRCIHEMRLFYKVLLAVSGREKQQPICKRKSVKINYVLVTRPQSWGFIDKRILELTIKYHSACLSHYIHLYICIRTNTERGKKIRRQHNWRRKASTWRALQTDRGRDWYQEH